MRNNSDILWNENNKVVIRDWSSAVDLRNHLDPHMRVAVCVYCNDGSDHGYSLEVYEKGHPSSGCKCSHLIYKFDVDCDLPNHCTSTTQEAIEFLNDIGFNCDFDYSVFQISEEVKSKLTNFYELGYKTITRVVRPWTEICLSTCPEDDLAKNPFYHTVAYLEGHIYPKGTISSDILNYRDCLFLPPNTPTPISEIIK